MSQKPLILLQDVGSKLQNPPPNKDALIRLLKQATSSLSELEQSPPKEVLKSMQPFVHAIVKPELLKHHDKEVKLLVAACTCEITRVTAPEAPYDDGVLKDIFHLIVSTFSGLRDTKGPSYGRRVTILEMLAKYRLCIVMLDLECDDLINEMFTTFFAVASDVHSDSVITSMKTIMAVLLEENEDINQDLLLIILSILGRDKKATTTAARKLAMSVIGQCAVKLEPGIKHVIVKSMSGEAASSSLSQINYHEIIYDIYRCAPQALAGIIPYLSGELLTDKLDVRLKAVKLVGDLFSIPGCSIPDMFHPLFLDFLKRLTDRVVEVRISVLEHIKLCMLSTPSRSESPQLIAALCDRLLDYDESIRQKVVEVVSGIACRELSSVSPNTIKLVADRLRDKSLLVKKYTMERLSDIYLTSCTKHMSDGYIWIPGRLLRCFYDKDFRSDTVEYILSTSLFPSEFSVKDKVRMWVRLFSKFDKVEIKALEKILEQKQRLQLELQKYLSLRKMFKGSDALEVKKKVMACFRFMSHCFTDPTKAESDFLLLHQLKDANVWKILTTLLDPTTSSLQSFKARDELLKIVGQKHPLYGFLSILSIKCSYILFNKDYVNDIILEMELNRSSTQSCMNILVTLASFSPLLLSGTEKDLVHLLEDDNDIIKEGVLHILAKAGGVIRKQLGESSSKLDLLLEKICLEGSWRLAKHAVLALAAITKDDEFKSLSVLYKKLVDMLEKKTHLPSVLQSLGCTAQIAMPVFETQEAKIQNFIKKDILGCSEKASDKTKESWDDRTELCSLKIYGIKTLVKSCLPMKDAHLRVGIDELIKDLNNILTFGEISKDIESSRVDKAHLKLASAKAILRLSRHWDNKIPVDVFYLALRTSVFEFPEAKRLFLNKVHQYIKGRSLDLKYACAFLLDLNSHQSVQKEKLNDIIQMCLQGKARQVSGQSDGKFSVVHPEYILQYLIHALAHHPLFPNIDECKELKAYEPIYRKLYLFLSMLAHGDENGKPGSTLKKEEVISVLSILGSIRKSEDAIDTNMSKNLYAICDLCFLITKRLAQKQEDLEEPLVHVSLPQGLYVSHDKKVENETEKDKKEKNKTEKDEKVADKDKKEGMKTEGHTWLGEPSVVAHFDSLNIEANESADSVIIDDLMKDIEDTDGNEVPLGKILERLKARGAKDRKLVKTGSSPVPVSVPVPPAVQNNSNKDNDNTNNVDNIVLSNGHEITKADEKHKRKRIPNQTISVSVVKRQKSTVLSVFDDIKMSDLEDGIHTKEDGNTDGSDLENPKKDVNTDDNNKKSGPVRKRKRASVAGLIKCTSTQGENKKSQHTTDLIGRRIKIWWPKDKEFYEGLVKSYDHEKNRHVVLYNDGDVEVLHLDKERWMLVKNSPKPTKRNKSSKSPRSKKGSSKKKNEVTDAFKENKESSDIKRAPRKSTRQRRKRLEYKVEKPEDLDDISDSQHEHEDLTFSKVDTLDSEEEAENRFSEPESENVADVSGLVEDEAELSDDMPLSVWKSQVRKPNESK
ncbi:sister chromatid cohesion protein PDS5 homolog A-like isoform X2 [Bidens hawaiensis]|uniref:sister chromatid cohesion protein PDS5 homolog A-like isoform X2 n=1 Tax=Bidens hawaiensis TaxID=980011 RepID=UPI004049885A